MDKLFYIVSIYTNAYLYSIGFRSVKKEKSEETGKVILFYEDTAELREAIKQYQSNYVLQDFIRGLKEIKGIILK